MKIRGRIDHTCPKKIILLYLIILISSVYFLSCGEESIVIEKVCNEEPDINETRVRLLLYTDTTIEAGFELPKTGYFSCNNIIVSRFGLRKSANFSGSLCKDNIVEMFIWYNDTTDNSKLKVNARQTSSGFFSGEILYCPNTNNICNYSQIGLVYGTIGAIFNGTFTSPIYFGTFKLLFS